MTRENVITKSFMCVFGQSCESLGAGLSPHVCEPLPQSSTYEIDFFKNSMM